MDLKTRGRLRGSARSDNLVNFGGPLRFISFIHA